TVKLLATDNSTITPAGWAWTVSFSGFTGAPDGWNFFLLNASGSSQNLADLAPVASVTTMAAYMPLPSGTPAVGQVRVATGVPTATVWPYMQRPVTTLLAAWRRATCLQTFQTGHGWSTGGKGLGSSNLIDTSPFVRGSKCAAITTDGMG